MEKENNPVEIELRSEAFQEIVEQSPRWLIRSGITLIFGLLILMLVGSYFFKYPDVIKTNVVLASRNSLFPGDSVKSTELNNLQEIKSPITGRINLPVNYASKVSAGQKVNIKLEDYPSSEYGFLKGVIKSISPVPKNGTYSVEVELPPNLTTSFDIPIKFSPGMNGSAEIITEDLRLIQRFMNPAYSLLKHRKQ